MSVIIKDLKMPESCFHCMLAFQDQDSEHNVYWTCAPLNEDAMGIERSPDCPLVEIPPHGRLIDAEELCQRLYSAWHTADKEKATLISDVMASVVVPIIAGIPTVIEKEEASDEL